jgi:hypothetical protein
MPAILGRPLAALALAAALAACGGKAAAPSATEIVSRSASATSKLTSFHLVVDIENVRAPTTGISVTFIDGDFVVPDRLRARISGTFQRAPLSSDLIVVGREYFLKDPFTGSWRNIEVSMSPVAFFDPAKGVLAVISGATDVRRDGSETVGGVESYRLKAKVRAAALTPLLGNAASSKLLPVALWIGKDDMLLRRIRLRGALSRSDGPNAVRTVELSRFGVRVQIVAPVVQG